MFGWYSPREPASLAFDCEQGDLFYSAWAPRRKLRWLLKLMQLKGKGRIWKKMKLNGPGREKLGQGRNSWQCAKHT